MSDRNFDDIAAHFAKKVYGGLKGEIRLAVLRRDLADLYHASPLRILDIGAGFGQIALELAQVGHDCTLSDLSQVMLNTAQKSADTQGIAARFVHAPYQALSDILDGQFDVILCHALLEWIDTPADLFVVIDKLLKKDGLLSLCFYNPASAVYRNLLLGNFKHLKNPKPPDAGSLTPSSPVAYGAVLDYLKGYQIQTESGIRTFYDYAAQKRGGLADRAAVLEMELKYSQKLPYKMMGRYLHVVAKKQTTAIAPTRH